MGFPLGKEWQLPDAALLAVIQGSTTAADIANQLQLSFPLSPDLWPQNPPQAECQASIMWFRRWDGFAVTSGPQS